MKVKNDDNVSSQSSSGESNEEVSASDEEYTPVAYVETKYVEPV